MNLALGTVQFGMSYGIANTSGQVDIATVAAILRYAKSKGLDTLDTAITYGVSEQRLGKVGVDGWRIISKLPEVPKIYFDHIDSWVCEQVQCSLRRLNVTQLTGILLHQPNQLLGENGKVLWNALKKLKQNGIVEKIGFSVYAPAHLDALYASFHPDLVQMPYNVLDRRLVESGWLKQLHEDKVEVHTRSLFLQGLLLMREWPENFQHWFELKQEWNDWLDNEGISALKGCLGFAACERRIDRVIVGVESVEQLKQILESVDSKIMNVPSAIKTDDPDLINPSRWSEL